MNGYQRRMQQGGDPQQDQIMQLIQAFAQMQGIDPQEIIARLQQLSPEEQQQAIQEMAQVVQEAMSQQQAPQQGQMSPAMQEQAMMMYGGYMNHPMQSSKGGLDRRLSSKMEDGGSIKIDARKKGTFKAQASKMGMSVQEAASHILKNKSQYSPTLVKKANFARNFAKEFGGQLDEFDLRDLY